MNRTLRGAGLVLALLAAPLPALAQRALTPEQWREDLRFLAVELPKRHRNAFHKIPRAQFDSAVAALDARMPALSDHEAVIGLATVVALIGDGHSRLTLPQDYDVAFDRAHTSTDPPRDSRLFLHHLPVKLARFADGLFVRAATREQRALIGARVVRIARMSADSALEAVRPVAHYDNEPGFTLIAPTLLVVPEVLHAMKVAASTERVTLTVQHADGRVQDVTLEPVALFGKPEFIEARTLLQTPPLWERKMASWYWLETLPAARAIYVQINRIGSTAPENITDFARRVATTFAATGAERLILDLRHNPGGNGNMNRPLVSALLRDARINRFGHLFVLIGRETFSAAQMLVNDLEHSSNALFVGEPTGGSPSGYGDSRKFKLPNSGLTVRASTIYWRDHHGNESRPFTPPDLPVPLTARDYFAGRDPVLQAALDFRATGAAGLVRTVQQRGGWPQAMRICWAHAADPLLDRSTRSAGMAACGDLLLEQGRATTAVDWFRAMLDYLPDDEAARSKLARAQAAVQP